MLSSSLTYYPDLNNLSKDYFKKYMKDNVVIMDYICESGQTLSPTTQTVSSPKPTATGTSSVKDMSFSPQMCTVNQLKLSHNCEILAAASGGSISRNHYKTLLDYHKKYYKTYAETYYK